MMCYDNIEQGKFCVIGKRSVDQIKRQTLFDCKKKEAISLLFFGIFDIQACNTTSPVFIVAGTSITR